jgi:hypothetical protein
MSVFLFLTAIALAIWGLRRVSKLEERLENAETTERASADDAKRLSRDIARLEKEAARRDEALDSMHIKEAEQSVLLGAMTQARERLAKRLVKDAVKAASDKLTSSNYATIKTRLQSVFEFCEKCGYAVPEGEQKAALAELKSEYEAVVRREVEREEQARIKAQIREEAQLERDRQVEMKRIESEREAIARALATALKRTHDEHSAEVEALRARLTEAELKVQRAKSQAELTRAGHVYVISNIGSFGENVYKVGMTRRLEPMDRVKELGDASVPFPFDVHMMIGCNDAPALENALHRELHRLRVNRINFRKEFFRVDLQTIRTIVERNHGTVEYQADPAALEYRESASMTDVDFDFVSTTVGSADEDSEAAE